MLRQNGKKLGGVPFLECAPFGAAAHLARLLIIRELAVANRRAESVPRKTSQAILVIGRCLFSQKA